MIDCVANIERIMNGYMLRLNDDSSTRVYFENPKDAGVALVAALGKERLTRTGPVQLDMFDNLK